MSGYSEEALGLLREAEDRMLAASETGDPAEGLVLAVDALRLTLVAVLEPREDARPAEEERWCRVELFGHAVTHGLVREVEAYGRRWLEVVQPAVEASGTTATVGGVAIELNRERPEPETHPERSKRYHPNAVYALTEVPQEQVARHVAGGRGLYAKHEPGDDIPF